MSGDQDSENKLSADTITEDSLDLSPGITDDDKLLWRKDKNAVDFSLNYAKLWCKFCKELVVALEKKATLEIELCRSWSKQFQSFETTISSSVMFGAPMRSESLNLSKLIIDQCKEIETQNIKKLGKLLDVINRQRTEFSKTRKHYKEKWKSDCKRMMDAENTMLKTKSAYYQRCQQGVKLREELTNAQALLTYMQEHGIQDTGSTNVTAPTSSSNQSNICNTNVDGFGSTATLPASSSTTQNDSISASQMSKQKLKVDKLEKQLADNDKKEIEQMYSYKESVENANNKLIEFEKKKMEHLCDIRLTTSRSDEVVKDTIAEYLRILAETRTTMLNEYSVLSNKFQEYKPCYDYRSLIEKQMSTKPDVYSEKFQVELYHDCATSKEKSESQVSKGFTRFGIGSIKETDHESRNRSTLPSHSDSDSDTEITPTADSASTAASNRTGVLNTIVEFGSNLFRQGGTITTGTASNEGARRNQQSKSKKSTSGSTSSMTGSGEGGTDKDLEWQKEVDSVFEIILKCIEVIEIDGLSTHGIYRVSASKLKVGSVMESLNNLGVDADLVNEQPVTLANVVKSKLISLSEPLVPYHLYNEFVDLGKEAETGEMTDLVNKLKQLISQLPQSNKKLAGLIFHHLKKIANNSEENQMGSVNLGTLFAPTLIKAKPRFRMADIKEYMDNKSQARVVQIIIENVEALFGSEEQYYTTKFTKEDNDEEIKTTPERESVKINKCDSEYIVDNKIKQQRPHSSIIETSVNISALNESSFSRPLSGSLRVPISSQSVSSSISSTPDKPAPKMMDMLLGKETISTIRSVSPRSRKINNESSIDKELSSVNSDNKDKNSSSMPHRSISVGSGPLPETIKLAQLSQPATDSIFSKTKDIENITITEKSVSNYTTADRYNELKRSFISSTESGYTSKSTQNSANPLNEHNIRSSNSLLSRSRPTSATTRSYNYSSNIDPSNKQKNDNQIDNIIPQSHMSFDPIPEIILTDSFRNSDDCTHFSKIIPKVHLRRRSKSYAVSVEPNNKSLNQNRRVVSGSPFIRQSKFRIPLSTKSFSDLRITNSTFFTDDDDDDYDDCNNNNFSNINNDNDNNDIIINNKNNINNNNNNNDYDDKNNIVNRSKSSMSSQYKKINKFFMKFCSVDNIDKLVNSKIAKYQSWLSQPVFDEFYV